MKKFTYSLAVTPFENGFNFKDGDKVIITSEKRKVGKPFKDKEVFKVEVTVERPKKRRGRPKKDEQNR